MRRGIIDVIIVGDDAGGKSIGRFVDGRFSVDRDASGNRSGKRVGSVRIDRIHVTNVLGFLRIGSGAGFDGIHHRCCEEKICGKGVTLHGRAW
jgi:hypothetical protein